jgi:hypothetical protein
MGGGRRALFGDCEVNHQSDLRRICCVVPYKNFDVSLTVHLSITLANKEIDAQFFKNTFNTILYMS